MGKLDDLKYEVALYELENGRWNYFVTVATRMAQGWSQSTRIGDGSTDSEAEALAEAQEKATRDRAERAKKNAKMKKVDLK
jgi:hypothetical protein